MNKTMKLCACGCGAITDTTPQGVQRDYIRGHNRRGKGRDWIEGGYDCLYADGVKIAEHRYIMERALGRKLGPNEVVHHINDAKLDNARDNLLVLTRSEHQRAHACSSRKPWKPKETSRALALRAAGLKIWEIALAPQAGLDNRATPREIDQGVTFGLSLSVTPPIRPRFHARE